MLTHRGDTNNRIYNLDPYSHSAGRLSRARTFCFVPCPRLLTASWNNIPFNSNIIASRPWIISSSAVHRGEVVSPRKRIQRHKHGKFPDHVLSDWKEDNSQGAGFGMISGRNAGVTALNVNVSVQRLDHFYPTTHAPIGLNQDSWYISLSTTQLAHIYPGAYMLRESPEATDVMQGTLARKGMVDTANTIIRSPGSERNATVFRRKQGDRRRRILPYKSRPTNLLNWTLFDPDSESFKDDTTSIPERMVAMEAIPMLLSFELGYDVRTSSQAVSVAGVRDGRFCI
ncbi:uncharacterized protein BDR25DRAFT_349707 [Lindgomyces ingoldianus]|uniref:Uncharacterized protein n=1 Tax=Lindgomyces ingoldianus TaxID=673940 RepID=A0ACB6RBE4_9PLEO|nr:uncharacterized protein BDR25DRAFT_349707 [Lindgomyces ingoldianus]KAF2476629.1 hypothetical protein BDR25DRAFT_349707 [Lindgomyces ingoldianus]